MNYINAYSWMSPLKVLSRGYALASKDGTVVRSVAQVEENDTVNLRLHDGTLQCRVEKRM